MNRAERRAEAARAKMQHNAERVRRLVDERNELGQQAEQMRMLLFAVARETGRLRVRRMHLDALSEDDRIDFVAQENGDVIVEYRGAK